MKGLERYKKIKNLGEGAQGNVVLSEDTLLGRKVAIKSLHQSLISDVIHVKRFEEEAKTLANFRHDNIINVYDIIANNEGCHLIMEYFEGYPLNQYIKNVTGPIPENKAVDIFIMILDAMSYIHKKNIIHRDIKPSNIMINDKSDIRLLDFGIAKNTEKDAMLTQIGGSAGYTPMYMSPEHCNGTKITKYSDIYSLGVTLWQILTGKAPYEAFTQGQIYLKVANEPLPSAQSIYPNVSKEINQIVQKATKKNPKDRFSSCHNFKNELLKLKNNKKSSPTLKKVLENKKLELSSIIKEIKNRIIPYLNNVKPNLINLFVFLKLNSFWAIDTLKLKLNKNQTETIKLIRKKRNLTKKAIDKSSKSVKPHKKEYATYLLILCLFIISIISMIVGEEKDTRDNKKYPFVSFENTESEGMESQTSVKIPIVLSQVSDSIIKIPLLFSGTATDNDFRKKSDTIVIQPNQKIGFIELLVSDDKDVESNETIIIELQNNTNFTLVEKQNYTYIIINDDKNPITNTKKGNNKKTTTTVTKKPTKNTSSSKAKTRTKSTRLSAHDRIRQDETHDEYSDVFGGKYFLLIKKNGNKKLLSVFDSNSGDQIGRIYEIVNDDAFKKNILKDINYKNHRLYTNRDAKGRSRAHLIDIRNHKSSLIKGPKIRNGYLGDGTEDKLTLHPNNK